MSRVRAQEDWADEPEEGLRLGHVSGTERVDYRQLGFYIPDLTQLTGWDWQPVLRAEEPRRSLGFRR